MCPMQVSQELVDAYLARRSLDYLVGYTISPVLWSKISGARSAGRVQSVALRIICDREADVEVFMPQEYWTLAGEMKAAAAGGGGVQQDGSCVAKLVQVGPF